MAEEKPHGALTVRVIAMPADTNANGDIFGGWVLSRMDQAGGIAAVERAKGLLMKARGLSEDEAYHGLRKLAMERGKTVGDTARDVIDMAQLLL